LELSGKRVMSAGRRSSLARAGLCWAIRRGRCEGKGGVLVEALACHL
jgi:hypothetical protein